MVHLEVRNKPPVLKGKELTHRNIECLAFKYDENKKELSIYETFEEWLHNTPAFYFCYVTRIIYWNDNIKEELE